MIISDSRCAFDPLRQKSHNTFIRACAATQSFDCHQRISSSEIISHQYYLLLCILSGIVFLVTPALVVLSFLREGIGAFIADGKNKRKLFVEISSIFPDNSLKCHFGRIDRSKINRRLENGTLLSLQS